MYTGKLARAARRAFVKADNDNPDNKQLFNFDEFSELHKFLEKSMRLGKVGSWKYFTVDGASILFVSSRKDCTQCLMTLHKKQEGNGPYQYMLCSLPGDVHLTLYNFKDIIKEAENIVHTVPSTGNPSVALVTA